MCHTHTFNFTYFSLMHKKSNVSKLQLYSCCLFGFCLVFIWSSFWLYFLANFQDKPNPKQKEKQWNWFLIGFAVDDHWNAFEVGDRLNSGRAETLINALRRKSMTINHDKINRFMDFRLCKPNKEKRKKPFVFVCSQILPAIRFYQRTSGRICETNIWPFFFEI